MNTNRFEMNQQGRHGGGREKFIAMFLSGRGQSEFGGPERGGRERGFGGPVDGGSGFCDSERGFGHRGHRGQERGFEGRHGGFGRGFGGRRGRLFDSGDVKLVVLKLLADQPSYGYQLIKSMEERLAGGYTPSAGVIYPTLTLLEEEGLTTSSIENGKKVYSTTAEGNQYLEANKLRVGELFERLEEAGKGFERGRKPEIRKAMMGLWEAVMTRISRGSATAEQITKITEAINAAAKAIDQL